MNNKQQVCPTEGWKYHFINSSISCHLYAWFCSVYVIFFFLMHPTGQCYDTQQLGGGGGGGGVHQYDTPVNFKYDFKNQSKISLSKTRNSRKMSLRISP